MIKLSELKEVSTNVNLDDYLKLYNYVRDNMENKNWLGTFPKEEIMNILNNGGKIWLYYDKDTPVCSMFYIPTTEKVLTKYHIDYQSSITGSLGPIMVSKDYTGNGLGLAMMNVLDEYLKSINIEHIFTKVHADNIYSIKNILKNGYKEVYEYVNERGNNKIFLK